MTRKRVISVTTLRELGACEDAIRIVRSGHGAHQVVGGIHIGGGCGLLMPLAQE